MSKVMWLVGRNLPLGHHEMYGEADMKAHRVFGGGVSKYGACLSYADQKKIDNIARAIIQGLSQYSVAKLLASEWEILPPLVRMAVTNLANTSNHSGNVRKGIAYLDQKIGGRLKRHETVQTERVIRIGPDGRPYRDTKAINKAQASAEKAFAIVSKPAGYENMTPAQKRKVQQELARARRNR